MRLGCTCLIHQGVAVSWNCKRDRDRNPQNNFNRKMMITKASFLGFSFSCLISPQIAFSAETTCNYDPTLGKPNPLGMSSQITITAEKGNAIFTYEQFAAPVADKITISQQKKLVFYDTTIAEARQILLKNPRYYSELVGKEATGGFAPVNAVLRCQ